MKLRTIVFCLFLSCTVALPAAGMQEANASAEPAKIVAYISGPSAMLAELETAFERDRGDVLDIVALGCGPLRQRVWTEYETGGILCDVLWGSDPLVYIALDEAGALYDYVPQGIEQVKSEYRTDGASYTLVNERYGVIIYNTALLQAEHIPTSYADLLDPEYDQAIVHADPEQSSTALALVSALYDCMGRNWDFHARLVDNHLYLAKKNSDVPSKVMGREFLLGIAPHDEAIRLQNKAKKEGYDSELGLVWPKEGALAIQRPIAISKKEGRSPEQQALCEQFVDFMIGKEAQAITVKYAFISVRDDVALPTGIPSDPVLFAVDWAYLSEHHDAIKAEFHALY